MNRSHGQEELIEVARAFTIEMANSGYHKATRWKIMKTAPVKYYREVAEWL